MVSEVISIPGSKTFSKDKHNQYKWMAIDQKQQRSQVESPRVVF